jgi:hypothetical protein
MISFKMTAFRLALPGFSREQMQRIGEAQLRSQKERISRGVNTSDQPARPLNPRYARTKALRGARPIRDMRYTGRTMSALAVQRPSGGFNSALGMNNVGTVVIRFKDQVSERKASINNLIDEMVGNSPQDTQAVMKAVVEEFPKVIAAVINAAEIIELLA